MAINSVATVIEYDCDGATTRFPITFTYLADANIIVKHYDDSTQTLSDLANPAGYEVVSDEVETVATYPIDDKIFITLDMDFMQETDLEPNGKIGADVLDLIHDKLTLMCQQLRLETDSVIGLEVPEPDADMDLPNATLRASRYLAFDALGNATVVSSVDVGTVTISAYGETVIAAADASALQTLAEVYSTTEVDSEVSDIAGVGRTTETVKDNADAIVALINEVTTVILEDGTDTTLPTSPSENDRLSIIAKGAGSSILQPADQAITYQGTYNTTAGVTGSLDLETKGRADLINLGAASITQDPALLNTTTPTVEASSVVGSNYDASYMIIMDNTSVRNGFTYKISNGVVTKSIALSEVIDLPLIFISISDDGVYAVMMHTGAPAMTFWKRTVDTFNRVAFTDPVAQFDASSVRISGDGVYVFRNGGAEVHLYKRTGDVLTFLAEYAAASVYSYQGMDVDGTGEWCVMTHSNTGVAEVSLYRRTGDVLALWTTLPSLPALTTYACTLSHDGNYLAIAFNAALRVWKWNGSAWVILATPASPQAAGSYYMKLSADGEYLVVQGTTSPFIRVYKNINDVYTITNGLSPVIASGGLFAHITPDANYIITSTNEVDEGVVVYNNKLSINNMWSVTQYESRLTDISGKFN